MDSVWDLPISVPIVPLADVDWGTFLDLAAVALPIILAVVGVIVSTVHLETRVSKFWWRSSVIVLGVIASLVAYEQQRIARINADKTTKDQVDLVKQDVASRYVPAGVLVYENTRFTFYNRTKSTLYFWGDKLADTPRIIEALPRMIPIDATYYIIGDKFEQQAVATIGRNGQDKIPFEMYFKNELHVKYTAVFILLIVTKDGNVQVHTQMISFDKSEW
jgi:hypothetical protein